MTLLAAVLLTAACADNEAPNNEEPLPEGMGRIRITICTPENVGGSTRAVNTNPWEVPDHDWEKAHSFRIFICTAADNEVVQIIEGTMGNTENTSTSEHAYRSATVTSQPLIAGDYHIFATANFNHKDNNDNDAYNDGFVAKTATTAGSKISQDATLRFANSSYYYIVDENDDDEIDYDTQYSLENIPMTGKLMDGTSLKNVHVYNAQETNAGTIAVWRVLGKMQLEFTNESDKDIKILGIEVDPINKVSSNKPGIFVFSKDDLTSTANLASGTGVTLPDGVRNDMGTVVFNPALINNSAQPLTLAAKNNGNTDQGKIYFYVNESDATFTTTENQLSLRFKVQRKKDSNTWYEEEIRYGVTTPYTDGQTGGNGFNVIRRNDWIHIPVVLTDWQFRVEPLAFVPIAGYPATTVSSDGLNATFSTGGMIALQPFVKKYDDKTWRDFGDPDISNISISWNSKAGSESMISTDFAYDSVTKCIIGELNNSLSAGTYMTTVTVNAQLGSYPYSFTFNIKLVVPSTTP